MSIRWRLIILTIAIAIIPMLLIAVLNYTQAKIEFQNSRISALEKIAELKVDKIELFFTERIGDIKTLQANPSIITSFPVLAQSAVDDPSILLPRSSWMDSSKSWPKYMAYLMSCWSIKRVW